MDRKEGETGTGNTDRASRNELMSSLERLHTTVMGEQRIRKNLGLDSGDAVTWCRRLILDEDAVCRRKGKNWYIEAEGCVVTVHAGSLTIITAHRI